MLLACVQTKPEPDAYRDQAAFNHFVMEWTRKALRERQNHEPALVAFPELVGLPLVFFCEQNSNATTIKDAALEVLQRDWREALRLGLRHLSVSPSALLLPRALALHRAYTEAFSRAAKSNACHIAAGSIFLPQVELEAAKGLHIAHGGVSNSAYMFGPTGAVLQRQRKINLTAGLEQALGLRRGQAHDVQAVATDLGRVSTLICYDAFFETLLERCDGLGAHILVQPSANAAKWHGPWSGDATKIEGEEWLARGPVARIQGRSNIGFCLNPMLVGDLFDLRFEGRSSIAVNKTLHPNLGDERGLLALAMTHDEAEVITAHVADVP